MTQKGTSWIGPLAIGALSDAMGEDFFVKITVFVILSELILGLPAFLFLFNLERGEQHRLQHDRKVMEEQIHRSKDIHSNSIIGDGNASIEIVLTNDVDPKTPES